MLSLLLIPTALALPSDGGIQVAMYKPGADFAESLIEGQSIDFAEDVLGAEVGCYDQVGIRDLNIHIPVGDAELEFADDTLTVDVIFDQIHGEDMVIFGEDGEWLDVCPGFETNFNSFQITNGHIRLTLEPQIEEGTVQMDVIGTPIISGNITTDIDWIPEELILTFVEDAIWSTLSDTLSEQIPELVTEYLNTTRYAGQFGNLDMSVEVVEVRVQEEYFAMGMDLNVEWNGESCLVMNAPEEPEGRTPLIDFGDGDGSDLGIAITERQLNALLLGAYADGLLCFEFGPLAGTLDAVDDSISDPVEDAELDIRFDAPPIMRMDEDRLRMDLDDFHLSLSGKVEGEDIQFFSLDADIEAAVELRVDSDISAVVLDLVYLEVDISDFQADPLLSDKDGAKERLLGFLDDWILETVAGQLQQVPLYGSLLHAADIFIRLDETGAIDGGLLIQASLFSSDDPEVDTEAPDTQARVSETSLTTVTIEWEGEDDKADALTFSWRINEGEWSDWLGGEETSVPAPPPGTHILEVRARDDWNNIDPSPALIAFEIVEEEEEKGCRCSTAAPPSGALAWLMLPLLWVRRRR